VIQFPETAITEWSVVAEAAEAEDKLRQRIRHETEVEREAARLRVRHEAAEMFKQELDAEATPVLEMATLAAYKAQGVAPVPVIEGVVNVGGTCLMLGPSGSGKSTLGLQMVHSMLTGEEWLGQAVKPLMGGAGIVSYDMDGSMVVDWMGGFPNMDQQNVSIVNAYKRGNPLNVPALRAQIVAGWQAMQVKSVLIDSFSASFFGSDQNDAAAVMAHYRDLQKFALTEVGADVLIVIVHSTLSSPDKARGSTVHHDVADSIVAVIGTGNDEREVKMTKYRAAIGATQMSPVVVTKPDSVTHLVSLDTGAMTLKGMALPTGSIADAFTDMPEPNEAPDTDTDSDTEGDDDL